MSEPEKQKLVLAKLPKPLSEMTEEELDAFADKFLDALESKEEEE
jgi:hypothetical protein